MGLKLISDMSMRIYSEASIAENPLLAAVLFVVTLIFSRFEMHIHLFHPDG
jgi:hypothetical protein